MGGMEEKLNRISKTLQGFGRRGNDRTHSTAESRKGRDSGRNRTDEQEIGIE
jgi:hypothetical protein